MRITWSDIKLLVNGISILWPSKFLISPCQYNTLNKITKQRYCTLLLVKQGQVLLGTVGFHPTDMIPPTIATTFGVFYEGTVISATAEISAGRTSILTRTRSLSVPRRKSSSDTSRH